MKLDRIVGLVVVAGIFSTGVFAGPPTKSGFRAGPAVDAVKDPVVSHEVRDAIGRRLGNVDALNAALEGKELTSRNIHEAAMKVLFPEGLKDGAKDAQRVQTLTDTVKAAFDNPTTFVRETSVAALAESVANGPSVCQSRTEYTNGDVIAKISGGRQLINDVLEVNKGLPKGEEVIADLMVGDAANLAAEGEAEAAGVQVHNAVVLEAAREVKAARLESAQGKCEGSCKTIDLNGDGKVSKTEGDVYVEGKVHRMFEEAFLGSRNEDGTICDAACAKRVADEWKERKCIRTAA